METIFYFVSLFILILYILSNGNKQDCALHHPIEKKEPDHWGMYFGKRIDPERVNKGIMTISKAYFMGGLKACSACASLSHVVNLFFG